jgi:soluble lytic murein transglycosylase
VGAHHEAVLLARESRIAPSVALSGREWMQIHYPLVFAPQVISHSRSVQVDPAWTWAIMREESLYKLRATSNAGAYGLMQVIPPTGAKIAQRLQLKNYQPQQLYEPDLSIRMGSWYLARLLQNYGQHILLASAAYNAGPHYVSAWLTHRYHLDFDVFVEEIFFTETREYTKRIFRSYAVYSQLYHQRLLGIVSSIKVNIVHNVDF